jgi:hypothetical protein
VKILKKRIQNAFQIRILLRSSAFSKIPAMKGISKPRLSIAIMFGGNLSSKEEVSRMEAKFARLPTWGPTLLGRPRLSFTPPFPVYELSFETYNKPTSKPESKYDD